LILIIFNNDLANYSVKSPTFKLFLNKQIHVFEIFPELVDVFVEAK